MSQEIALRKLRRLSQPIVVLLSIALGLLVVVEGAFAFAILCLFQGEGSWRAAVSFTGHGVNLAVFRRPDMVGGVLLETLTFGQRGTLALMTIVCAASAGMAVMHLRQLFALYGKGVVFEAENIRHIKRFAVWLIASAILTQVSGCLFLMVTDLAPIETTNVAMVLVYGVMTWAVAKVMEIGREADVERRQFI